MAKQSRGFASMKPATRKSIASKGGTAARKGDTSKRGFASMDPEKQRKIASLGGKASHGGGRKSHSSVSGKKSSGKGFASIDPHKSQKQTASKGGHYSHSSSTHSSKRSSKQK